MKTIIEEIREFLVATGVKQCALAREAGVSSATVCRIFKNKQKSMYENNALSLRVAMARLASTASRDESSEPSPPLPSLPQDAA